MDKKVRRLLYMSYHWEVGLPSFIFPATHRLQAKRQKSISARHQAVVVINWSLNIKNHFTKTFLSTASSPETAVSVTISSQPTVTRVMPSRPTAARSGATWWLGALLILLIINALLYWRLYAVSTPEEYAHARLLFIILLALVFRPGIAPEK